MGDAIAAARMLLPLPRHERAAMMDRLLYEAHLADCCRKRLGRSHATYGNGTLMDAAARYPRQDEPFLDDADYLDALLTVLSALRSRAGRAGRGSAFFRTCPLFPREAKVT
ncbi:hypothetical protein ACFQXB_12355 [Plastorhodobacter daqingensis]|uniref:DUF7742 domain-containing protein n=1 Tax=Plastorhodobacter daqingensis TaxID=1387281 RepID=A0ABW2UJV6_9RHOB